MGFVESIIMMLERESGSNLVEHLLSALLALVTDFVPAEITCRRSDLGLMNLLISIIKKRQGQNDQKVRT